MQTAAQKQSETSCFSLLECSSGPETEACPQTLSSTSLTSNIFHSSCHFFFTISSSYTEPSQTDSFLCLLSYFLLEISVFTNPRITSGLTPECLEGSAFQLAYDYVESQSDETENWILLV